MAGITMYLQLPFNSSSHLFYLHDLWESQTYMASCVDWGFKGGGGESVSTPGVLSLILREIIRDQDRTSLYNINTTSSRQVMRIKKKH